MAAAQNKVTFGISNGHYAVATPGVGNSYTFGTVKELPNLQSITATVVGGKQDVYADNKIVATLTSYSGQELAIKVSELSDEFKKDVLGYLEDTGKALCEVANAQVKTFAFGCQIEGDVYARRVWYYLCTATNPGESSTTKADTPTPNEPELTITVRPIAVQEHEVIRRIAKSEDSAYKDFFTTVTLPEFSPAL